MQKIADRNTGDGKLEPVFAMVAYKRMTDSELAKMKSDAKYDADKDYNKAVPNSCKYYIHAEPK